MPENGSINKLIDKVPDVYRYNGCLTSAAVNDHFSWIVGWPECSGIGGRLRPESVAGINRNGWPASPGIGGRNHAEYAFLYEILAA